MPLPVTVTNSPVVTKVGNNRFAISWSMAWLNSLPVSNVQPTGLSGAPVSSAFESILDLSTMKTPLDLGTVRAIRYNILFNDAYSNQPGELYISSPDSSELTIISIAQKVVGAATFTQSIASGIIPFTTNLDPSLIRIVKRADTAISGGVSQGMNGYGYFTAYNFDVHPVRYS